MDRDTLENILDEHKKWLADPSAGTRADLYGANLRGAGLYGANLTRAILREADLTRAILYGANLTRADLTEANLRWANLRQTKGFRLLHVQDPRGYSFAHAIETADGWRIRAGCRDFSIPEARAHWGEGYQGERQQGDAYLRAIDWFEDELNSTEKG